MNKYLRWVPYVGTASKYLTDLTKPSCLYLWFSMLQTVRRPGRITRNLADAENSTEAEIGGLSGIVPVFMYIDITASSQNRA